MTENGNGIEIEPGGMKKRKQALGDEDAGDIGNVPAVEIGPEAGLQKTDAEGSRDGGDSGGDVLGVKSKGRPKEATRSK